MAFTKKKIEIHIILANGVFANGSNTKVVKNLPCKVQVQCCQLPMKDQASVSIYGLKKEDLDALTWLVWNPLSVDRNQIAIYASDEGDIAPPLVFAGEIQSSVPEYNTAPDIALNITAISGYYSGMIAMSPYSFKGSIPVASILEELAKKIDYAFINNGNTQEVKDPYLKGSPIQQVIELAKNTGANINIKNNQIILNSSTGNNLFKTVISPQNGMIEYPTPTPQGFRVRAEFLSTVSIGDVIQIENSIIPKANGNWSVAGITHSLGCEMDNAPWFTELDLGIVQGI